MRLIEKIKTHYRNWVWEHSTPAKRGELLHNHFYPGNYKVGKGCEIYTSFSTWGSEPYLIEIGNNVRITAGVRFCTHDGGMWGLRNSGKLENADYFGRIIIEDNVHIGWNAIIMPNVVIGRDCVIGCGAVVTKDVPPGSVVVGVPARVIRSVDDYYNKYVDRVDCIKDLSRSEKEAYLIEKFNLSF